MRIKDLHVLPKFRDGWSYLYVEHCRVDQEAKAVAIHDVDGKVPVPCANLALLMLGPGVSITHAAITVLADHGCLVAWCGEQGVRFYAVGLGKTRSASNLLHQARMWSDEHLHMKVVRKLYQMRFPETLEDSLTLQQIRGLEGTRVREAYSKAAEETGIEWTGRKYNRTSWKKADPVNRALSAANSCLYGICHAAIVTAGFSPGLGFIHTGKMLSFVYDVADLYKAEITTPLAFRIAAEADSKLERAVRIACRDEFVSSKLLMRIIPDIQSALTVPSAQGGPDKYDDDFAAPGPLWDGASEAEGGCSYGTDDADEDQEDGDTDS